MPDNVKNAMEIVPVRWIDKVLELALERAPQSLPDEDVKEVAKAAPVADPAAATSEFIKH